jgi:hypothetical protein
MQTDTNKSIVVVGSGSRYDSALIDEVQEKLSESGIQNTRATFYLKTNAIVEGEDTVVARQHPFQSFKGKV